jgi:hypothetical protein
VAATETPPLKLIGSGPQSSVAAAFPHASGSSAHTAFPLLWILLGLLAPASYASELKPATEAAFNRYIRATESQMDSDSGRVQFLVVDRLPETQRRSIYDQLQQGQVYVQEVRTSEEGQAIPIPGGLVHHWAGVVFIPKARASDAIAILQDYENQSNIYKPDVRQAKLIEQHGDESNILEQFYSKSVVTVVLNAYFHVVETDLGSGRCQSVSRSTRIVEVEDAATPDEHERTDGKDHGYMWRLNSYWRVEEKGGGVYVQNESISLSRTIPVFFGWVIEPLTKSIPRELLVRMLTNTRNAVEADAAKSKPASRKEERSFSPASPAR